MTDFELNTESIWSVDANVDANDWLLREALALPLSGNLKHLNIS